MMIRNYGGDKEGLKEICGGAKEQQRRPSQVGVPIEVELKSNSDSRKSPHQICRPDHIPTPFWTFFIHIPSESKGKAETMRRTESVTVLCYHILAPWAMYQVGPNRGTP
jgi:hypothetical protein